MSKRQINRTELRKNMKFFLDSVAVEGPLFLDGFVIIKVAEYEGFKSMEAALEIVSNQKLFKQILKTADTLEEETRLGHLHSFEEAFEV